MSINFLHLMNVRQRNATRRDDTVHFDSNGNSPGCYDIMNYTRRGRRPKEDAAKSRSASGKPARSTCPIGRQKNGHARLLEGQIKVSVCSAAINTRSRETFWLMNGGRVADVTDVEDYVNDPVHW